MDAEIVPLGQLAAHDEGIVRAALGIGRSRKHREPAVGAVPSSDRVGHQPAHVRERDRFQRMERADLRRHLVGDRGVVGQDVGELGVVEPEAEHGPHTGVAIGFHRRIHVLHRARLTREVIEGGGGPAQQHLGATEHRAHIDFPRRPVRGVGLVHPHERGVAQPVAGALDQVGRGMRVCVHEAGREQPPPSLDHAIAGVSIGSGIRPDGGDLASRHDDVRTLVNDIFRAEAKDHRVPNQDALSGSQTFPLLCRRSLCSRFAYRNPDPRRPCDDRDKARYAIESSNGSFGTRGLNASWRLGLEDAL